jgi:prepilin-type N-terminal cleavage/methylation domain-containing protein
MTLPEVMVAMLIFGLLGTGIAASFIQSRKLTEGSVAQANAQAAVESYMEQMENMLLTDLTCPTTNAGTVLRDSQGNPTFAALGMIPTRKTNAVQPDDVLVWSNNGSGTPTIPLLSSIIPGVTHTSALNTALSTGIVDNLKEIPATPNNPGATTTWSTLWPSADNYAPTGAPALTTPTPSQNNLHMDIWVWVTDLTQTNSATSATNKNGNAQTVYGITIIYMWQFNNGAGIQYFLGTLHSIRSVLS